MLKKLSLAALIAMGSMSVASATPLTEAIKGVDLSGFLRIRFYNERAKDQNKDWYSYNRWRTNGIFIFTVPAGENIKFVVRESFASNVYNTATTATENNANKTTVVDANTVNNLLFMKYSKDGLNAIVGKIPVATSITSTDPVTPAHGAGIIATYAVNPNLTVGAAYVDALKQGGTEFTGVGLGAAVGMTSDNILSNDIYAAVVVFNTDMVSGNAWYYQATDIVKNIYTISADIKPVKFADLHVDYAHGKGDFTGATSTNYYNVSLKGQQDAFCALIGYAYRNDGNSPVVLGVDSPINAVIPTANNTGIAGALATKINAVYGKIGYNVDAKTNVYVAYQHQNDKSTANNDLDEYTVGGSYKYNKKLAFSAYYDVANFKVDTNDNNEFRFEAKYSF